MWKWIVGILLVITVVIAGTCYRAYREFTGEGPTTSVTFLATPEHLFAALSEPDSMHAWMPEGTTVAPLGKGPLHVGDTVTVTSRGFGRDSTVVSEPATWVLRESNAPSLLVFDRVGADTGSMAKVRVTRRDSIVGMGDSSTVHTTILLRTVSAENGTTSDAPGVAEKLMIGVFRLEAEMELNMLQRYLQRGTGTP